MNKNKALLLDRDGVINRDTGYIGKVADFEFLPSLFTFLHQARDLGYRLAILTNQSGVARGTFSEKDYAAVTSYMLDSFKRQSITIDLVTACFEHPEGSITPYKRESFWRKPNQGMVLEAIQRLDCDPTCSAFLGDNERDMQAAQAGGIGRCLWLTEEKQTPPVGVTIVRNYTEALAILSA
jgi:D-glycero-D-manno-heptose 1,7-bisphosphate phosphatase